MKLIRSPLVHFLLFGLLIFAVEVWRSFDAENPAESDSLSIRIDAGEIQELRKTFENQTGRRPDSKEVEFMISAEIEDEILHREALARGFLEGDGGIQARLIQKMLFLESEVPMEDAEALLARAISLGLHRDDIVVRRILIQKMRLHVSNLNADEKPSDEEVNEAYQAQRKSLREPDRRDLRHVFFSGDRRKAHAARDAAKVRMALVESYFSASEAVALGDPFPLGHRLKARSELDLQRSFGKQFGQDVFRDSIETWSQPIASAYGHHLVWTSRIQIGKIPLLEAAAGQIFSELAREKRKRKLESYLHWERSRYQIEIASIEEQE